MPDDKSSTLFSKPVQEVPSTTSASAAIRRFAEGYFQPGGGAIYKKIQAKKLDDFANNISLTAEQLQSTLTRAANITDPTGSVANQFRRRLAGAETPQQVLKELGSIMTRSTSVYTQRAVSLFMEDVEVLQSRAAAGLPVNLASLTTEIPAVKRTLGLGELEPGLRAEVERLQQAVHGKYGLRFTEYARKDLAGAELNIEFLRAGGDRADFTLRVPRVLQGQEAIITHGRTQQSRYIAGMYGLVEQGVLRQSFNHEQWMVRRAAEDLIPQIMTEKKLSQRAVNHMVSQFEQRMMEAPEWIPTIKPGIHQGLDEYTWARSQIMRLHAVGDMPGAVRPLTEFEFANIIERGGLERSGQAILPLYPSHSPSQIAKGVASTLDVRSAFSLVPEAVPYGRRPLQSLRQGFTPTAGALANLGLNELQREFGWAQSSLGATSPMMRLGYISPRHELALAGTGITSEGQLLISKYLSEQRAVSELGKYQVAAREGVGADLASLIDVQKGSKWDINKVLKQEGFMGTTPEGRPLVLPKGTRILSATAHGTGMEKFIDITTARDIEDLRVSKVFGAGKGMAREVDPGYMTKILSKIGVRDLPFAGHAAAVDALIMADELKKNRGLHYNQMFTALWDFTQQNMQSGKIQGSTFERDPYTIIGEIRDAAKKKGHFSHEVMLGRIVGLAREARLTPEQMGMVFGAVPDVFGDLGAMGTLSAAEQAAIQKGYATGVGQLFFAGQYGTGTGKMATMEPRMYELLGSPHFGKLGTDIQVDLAQRMIRAYPERLMEQQELATSLKSIGALARREGAISATEMMAGITSGVLPATAASLRVGKLGDIYIPGSAQLSQLAAYKTKGGFPVSSELAHQYRGVIESAQLFEQKAITEDVMRKELGGLQEAVSRAYVGTITGKEGTRGLLRQRMPGSMFLTAMQPTAETQLPAGVVGITKPYAERMFQSMRDLGIYNEAALKEMESKFMAGGRIGGLIGRHPFIDQFSTQAVQYQMVAGDQPLALIGERLQRAAAFRGERTQESLNQFAASARRALAGDEKSIRRIAEMGGEMIGSPIRLSPLVGLAGDVDGDIVAAVFAGPQLEKSLTSHIADRDALAAYEEYAIRSQVLKAKTSGDAITLRKAMAGDVVKLGITEGGRLGSLSVGLQQYRAAVLSGMGGLSAQETSNALGLLSWMEQTPISGKHIPPGQEEKMIHLLDDIQRAIDKKEANAIADAARAVLAKAKVSGQAALKEGFTIAMEDLDTGKMTTRYIPGLDIAKSAENIADAMRAYEASSLGQLSQSRIRRMIMGRGGFSTGQEAAVSLMDPAILEQSPFGAFFEGTEKRMFSEYATRASAALNKVGAAGRSMIPHAKPIAIGTGVALGIAAFLSEPPRILPPGSTIPPEVPKAGSGGAQMDAVHPDSKVSGEPTAESPVRGANTARVAQPQDKGYRVNIQGNSAGNIDIKSLNQQLRTSIGGRTRVNSTVKDMRSSLTPQKLSSILEDE